MEKVILITGASSGIGKETAKLFAAKGWQVVATMRSPEKENELNALDNIFITRLDVQDQDSITSAIATGIDKFGHIDVLINNAGYGQFGIFEATKEEKIREQFDVNVFGVMNTIRTILPHFRERKAGTILNISSGAGKFTLPLISLYAASKFALEGFSEALSYELGSLNIRVKIVEPGGASTNFSAVSNQANSENNKIADYDPFISAASKMFQDIRNFELVKGTEVAAVIYQAVTDGTDTLRYSIGNEDFQARMDAREKMNDQNYVDSIRNGFLKYLPE
ncbi:SDR family oxidoreductase [Mucilaginibacter pallidiroseus]|uniref:SDR family oxidoreductase n=1 Tax=Mucilaginibacter pallidiroseus TaxID=2599295 RepID=A0A563TYL8_9SPHI|nr:SDR family oxidoreductase [Mucilaginibacter pallidiroseus]TWR24363.1 SDR family oxidoreductase [Mucilaginibacter pallidiroseus]